MIEYMTKGNCYLCGAEISKQAFRKHLETRHGSAADGQECILLKVESVDQKVYWLYLDMPASAALKALDRFLRNIWLECCGHESAFFTGKYTQVSKSTKIGELRQGSTLRYEYDFGSTTELRITVSGWTPPEAEESGAASGPEHAAAYPLRKMRKGRGLGLLRVRMEGGIPVFLRGLHGQASPRHGASGGELPAHGRVRILRGGRRIHL